MTIRFGLIGGSAIAERAVIPALLATAGVAPELLASRTEARCRWLAERFGLRATPDYDAVLADPAIDAVYISLPNALHEEWTLRALEAGKHVLVEKPLALSEEELRLFEDFYADRSEPLLLTGFNRRFRPQRRGSGVSSRGGRHHSSRATA